MATPRHTRRVLLALAFGACVAPPPVAAPLRPALDPRGHVHTAPAATGPDPRATWPRSDAAGPCPIAFDDADIVIARVGEVAVTACDVAVLAVQDAREGRTPRAPAARLDALVAEALLADEARARGLEDDAWVAIASRDVLAAALVRDQALDDDPGARPSDADVAAYYAAHGDEFAAPERAHLREIVLATEAQARDAIRDAATVPFDQLVRERTVSPDGRRDEGDLGLVAREGNDRVPRALADAGFAIEAPGGVASEPVRVEQVEHFGRHDARARTIVRWHVVQRLDTVPATQRSLDEAARAIRHRLGFARFEAARDAARATLLASLRRATPPEVHAELLRSVRLRRGDVASAPR